MNSLGTALVIFCCYGWSFTGVSSHIDSLQPPAIKLEETIDTFLFRCDVTNKDPTQHHIVRWLLDGNVFLQKPLTAGVTSAVVTENELQVIHGNDTVAGKHVRCAVSAVDPFTNAKTDFVYSPEPGYYLGFKFTDSNGKEITELSLDKQHTALSKVYVESTIPVRCNTKKWQLDFSLGFMTHCYVELRVENPALTDVINQMAGPNCSPHYQNAGAIAKRINFGVCSIQLTNETWRDYWNNSMTITIPNDGATQLEQEVRYVKLYADSTYQRIWNGYSKFLKIKVKSAKAPATLTPAACSNSAGTVTTFDKAYYIDNQVGEAVLYESTQFNARVHVFSRQCYDNSAKLCYCAAAAQAGDDVIIVDGCNAFGDTIYDMNPPMAGQRTVRTKIINRDDPTPGFKLEQTGNTYTMMFPHGAELKLTSFTGSGLSLFIYAFNFHLTPSVQDYNDALATMTKVHGLCGTFTRDERDDLRLRNGTTYSLLASDKASNGKITPSGFLQDWSVAKGSRESMYNGEVVNTAEFEGHQQCSCVVNRARFSAEHVMCTFGNPCTNERVLIDKVNAITVGRRRKRYAAADDLGNADKKAN